MTAAMVPVGKELALGTNRLMWLRNLAEPLALDMSVRRLLAAYRMVHAEQWALSKPSTDAELLFFFRQFNARHSAPSRGSRYHGQPSVAATLVTNALHQAEAARMQFFFNHICSFVPLLYYQQ
jgi:hypothetical protein